MDPLCDVEPFQCTPAWPPALRVRLARSPHAPGFRPPFGLEQKVFCSLGISPRWRGSSRNRTSMLDRGTLRPCPGSLRSPPKGTPVSAMCVLRFQVFSASRTSRNRLTRLVVGEPPLRPCSPRSALHASGGRGPASRCRAHPQHQARPSPHTPPPLLRNGPARLPASNGVGSATRHPPAGRAWPFQPSALSRYGPPHPPPARPSGLSAPFGYAEHRPTAPAGPRRQKAEPARRYRAAAGKGISPSGPPPLPERTTYGFPLPASGTLLFPLPTRRPAALPIPCALRYATSTLDGNTT